MMSRTCIVAFCAALCAVVAAGQNQMDAAVSNTTPVRILGLQYPRLAHLAVVQGKVELQAGVLSDGTVKEIRVISGHPLLIEAAEDSLRQWRFIPCSSSSVQCSAKVTFIFVLKDGLCELPYCPNDIQIDLPATITVTSKQARAIIN